MFHVLCRPLDMPASTVDGFDGFNMLKLIDFPLTPALFQHLRVSPRLARLLPRRGRGASNHCEAVMWKITTRGFTLEEVLIMAAMNLLANADTAAKRENRTPQKSKGEQACG
jgi:hypothetical protein